MTLTSPKGIEMIKTVSPIYIDCQVKIMMAIFEAIGYEWDEADKLADEVLLQLFPQTATWGLRYWENLLKIPTNETIPIDKRRALVLSKIKLRAPMTPKRIADIVYSLTKENVASVEVEENVEPYTFMVTLTTKEGGIDYLAVYKTIKEIKPSHESFIFGNNYLREFYLKIRRIYGLSKIQHAIGTFVCGEEERPFIATKGYRNSKYIYLDINKIVGMSRPLPCSKNLKFTTPGQLNDTNIQGRTNRVTGTSNPLVCSKNLKYTRIEVVA